jgi:cytochrome c oxidase assembly protein Cox11
MERNEEEERRQSAKKSSEATFFSSIFVFLVTLILLSCYIVCLFDLCCAGFSLVASRKKKTRNTAKTATNVNHEPKHLLHTSVYGEFHVDKHVSQRAPTNKEGEGEETENRKKKGLSELQKT